MHGFRSTFRDWCAEAAGNAFAPEVCEHALAHSLPSKVEAAYRRGDLLHKRVTLMQAWPDYCCSRIRQRSGRFCRAAVNPRGMPPPWRNVLCSKTGGGLLICAVCLN